MGASEATSWLRVSHKQPCPICGKPDWCTITADGTAACCMRTESGRHLRNGGWLHRLSGARQSAPLNGKVRSTSDRATVMVNWDALQAAYAASVKPAALVELAKGLNVSPDSLRELGIGWDGEAWTMPMRLPDQTICGIQRRTVPKKCCVTGSKLGIFVPCAQFTARASSITNLLVTEGASDCARLLTLGYQALGRASCTSTDQYVVSWCLYHEVRNVVLIGDNDTPGRKGVYALSRRFGKGITTRAIFPPDGYKDVRAYPGGRTEWQARIKAVKSVG